MAPGQRIALTSSYEGKNRNSKHQENDGNGSKTQKDTHRVSLFCSFK